MRSSPKYLVLPVVAFALGGCTGLEPLPESPIPEPFAVPNSWSTDSDNASIQPWSEDIEDSGLQALITQALDRNFDLQSAVARVEAARARVKISGADRYPQIDAVLTGSRAKRGSDIPGIDNTTRSSFSLDSSISWEADLWGRLRASTQASIADLNAVEWDLAAVKLSLSANIARAWFNAIEAQQQTDLASRTLDSFEDNLSTIEQQFRRGISEALDVRLARGNVATARANLYARQRILDSAVRTLEVLTGGYPGATLKISETLPDIKPVIPTGLPSELVSRRPDIRAAQWRLAGSQARVSVAERARFPRFNLTANGGTSSDSLSHLLDWDHLVWSVVTGITQPLFQGFRIKANILLSQANNSETIANYASVLLTAFNEVETALAAEAFLVQQETALSNSVEETQQAVKLADQQYRQGLIGIVTLLEAQRRTFNSESSWLQTVNARLQNRVNLHLALGGNFSKT